MPNASLPLTFAALAWLSGDPEPPSLLPQPAGSQEQGLWIDALEICSAGAVTAEPGFDERTNWPVVNLRLSPILAERFAALTARKVGQPLAIRYNGRTISEPIVNEPIPGGQVQISGMDFREAKQLAADLNSCDTPANSAAIPATD